MKIKEKSIADIKVKKLNTKAILPYHGSECAAGYDLYSCIEEPITIRPHETVKISTGLAMKLPDGYFGAIFARSGLATKQGLRPGNCVGVIDEDYTGDIIVSLHNDSNNNQIVMPGQRVAQFILLPYLTIKFDEVDSLTETKRGTGGFGSTGIA